MLATIPMTTTPIPTCDPTSEPILKICEVCIHLAFEAPRDPP